MAAGKASTFDRSKYATLLPALQIVITTEAEYGQTITEKPSKDEAFFCVDQLDIHLLAKVGYQWMLQAPQTETQAPRENQKSIWPRLSTYARERYHFSSA